MTTCQDVLLDELKICSRIGMIYNPKPSNFRRVVLQV